MVQVAPAVAFEMMQAVPQLMRQRHALEEEMAQPKFVARLGYAGSSPGQALGDDPNAELKSALEHSLMVFETTLATAALLEVAALERVSSCDDLTSKLPRLRSLASAVIGATPEEVFARYPAFQVALRRQLAPTREEVDEYYARHSVHLDLAVRQVRALLASCPIQDIERTAVALGGQGLAHRHRVAFERLTAFVRRHDTQTDAAFTILGHAFMQGRVSLDEIIAATQLPPEDAVKLLEDLGFARSAEVLLTGPGSRPDARARLRTDRLARGGKPVVDEDLIRREVIATQRIEEVDARPWLPAPQG